jgi:predicted aminopeptidase
MENEDQALFSHFISVELKNLEQWYKELPEAERLEIHRTERIAKIQKDFSARILPQLKTDSFKKFSEQKLNNARLLVYKTYMQDLQDFEILYSLLNQDYFEFIKRCKNLEKSSNPAEALKELIQTLQNNKARL